MGDGTRAGASGGTRGGWIAGHPSRRRRGELIAEGDVAHLARRPVGPRTRRVCAVKAVPPLNPTAAEAGDSIARPTERSRCGTSCPQPAVTSSGSLGGRVWSTGLPERGPRSGGPRGHENTQTVAHGTLQRSKAVLLASAPVASPCALRVSPDQSASGRTRPGGKLVNLGPAAVQCVSGSLEVAETAEHSVSSGVPAPPAAV